jgi:hypothetical protein
VVEPGAGDQQGLLLAVGDVVQRGAGGGPELGVSVLVTRIDDVDEVVPVLGLFGGCRL